MALIGGEEHLKVWGKRSRNVFNQKIDYAPAEVSTRYGISGVKVWISYSKKGGACYIRKVRNIINIVKADVVGVANRTVHNSVSEDMVFKVVELVVFHIEPEAARRAIIGHVHRDMSGRFPRNGNKEILDREEKKRGEKEKAHMMKRKGNPISVRLDLNRRSDSSWFSEDVAFFQTLMGRVGFSVVWRTLYHSILKGCPGSLIFALVLMVGAFMNAETELAKMMDPFRSGTRGRLPDLNEPPLPMDIQEEDNGDAALAPHKRISKADLESSISQFNNFLRKRETEASSSGEISPAAYARREELLRGGCWDEIVRGLRDYGENSGISKHRLSWQAALKKVVLKEGTDLSYLRTLKDELYDKGTESDGLGKVAFHSSRSERVKGKGWVAPYKFLKSDGTKAHIGNETQTYGLVETQSGQALALLSSLAWAISQFDAIISFRTNPLVVFLASDCFYDSPAKESRTRTFCSYVLSFNPFLVEVFGRDLVDQMPHLALSRSFKREESWDGTRKDYDEIKPPKNFTEPRKKKVRKSEGMVAASHPGAKPIQVHLYANTPKPGFSCQACSSVPRTRPGTLIQCVVSITSTVSRQLAAELSNESGIPLTADLGVPIVHGRASKELYPPLVEERRERSLLVVRNKLLKT
ncbi:ribosomal protein S3 [Striga asiatica]|uniref:Ribosomal protein S3 n=1 Tax=Striga asiatica TaxID=4170 RepID=A0A5A7PZ13_STRAF|nr:ribosomal protein S3 [Striga asiatica]